MGDTLCRGGGDVGDGFWPKILSDVRRQGEQCPGETGRHAVFLHRTEQPIPLVSRPGTCSTGCAQLDFGGGAILWSVSQTAITMHERQDLQARLDHVRVQDHQLVAEAQREGLDLSGPSLQQLPLEVSLVNQLLTKRHFPGRNFCPLLKRLFPRMCRFRVYDWIPGARSST